MSNTKDGVRIGDSAGGGDSGGGAGGGVKPPRPAAAPLDRGAVLRATAEVLDEHGFEKTTIRVISAKLDCAVGSIYRHFTDKNQLLDAVVQGRFTDIASAAESGVPLDATTRAFVASAARRPEQYRLMFWLSTLGRGAAEAAAMPEVMRRLLDAWSAGSQCGDADAARSHWGNLHGQLLLGLHDGRGDDEGAALEGLRGPTAPGGATAPAPVAAAAG